MKLLRKQYYIFVDSKPYQGVESFSVRITSNLKSLLKDWGPNSRISPLWQLKPTLPKGFKVENSNVGKAVSMWFLHGLSAEFLRDELKHQELAKLYHESMWLTLGAHSLVLICRDNEIDERLAEVCTTSEVAYERWEIEPSERANEFSGGQITIKDPADYSATSKKRRNGWASSAFAKTSIEADDSLGFMQLELYALLAVVEGRSKGVFSVLVNDAMQIEAMANGLIVQNHETKEENKDDIEDDSSQQNSRLSHPDILFTLNAGLSRLSSQALSGTTPILRTECHFWPHSLLGIGVANLGLRNITTFLSSLAQYSRYDHRIFELRKEEFDTSKYTINKPNGGFPDFVCIDHIEVNAASNLDNPELLKRGKLESEEGKSATPITYFSGRDGFMNDVLTTSAPLSSVSGANSYQWNLGTITHEISHRILSGHIYECMEDFLEDMSKLQKEDETDWKDTQAYFQTSPETFAEYASRMIGRTFLLLHCLSFDEAEMKLALNHPSDFFFGAYDHHAKEIEELLVHIFDFYHFYGEDPKKYCDFIWLSWAVQPSIERNLEEYVKRTLVALSVKHFARENWKKLAVADFLNVLKEEPLASRLHLCPKVKDLLNDENKKEDFDTFLDTVKHLVILFHMYFKLDQLQTGASAELFGNPEKRVLMRNGKKERRYYHYRNSANTFVSENSLIGRPRFSNPLVFLRDFSREERPNAAQSAWLLHMLAFNVDLQRTGEDVSE